MLHCAFSCSTGRVNVTTKFRQPPLCYFATERSGRKTRFYFGLDQHTDTGICYEYKPKIFKEFSTYGSLHTKTCMFHGGGYAQLCQSMSLVLNPPPHCGCKLQEQAIGHWWQPLALACPQCSGDKIQFGSLPASMIVKKQFKTF